MIKKYVYLLITFIVCIPSLHGKVSSQQSSAFLTKLTKPAKTKPAKNAFIVKKTTKPESVKRSVSKTKTLTPSISQPSTTKSSNTTTASTTTTASPKPKKGVFGASK